MIRDMFDLLDLWWPDVDIHVVIKFQKTIKHLFTPWYGALNTIAWYKFMLEMAQ